MKRFLFSFLAFVQFVNAYTQTIGTWSGDVGAYEFADGNISLNTTVTETSTSTIYAPLSSASAVTSWQFDVNLNLNPSDNNLMRVYVLGDDAEFNNGFDILIGDKDDYICFRQITNGTSNKRISTETKVLDKSSSSFWLRLEQYYTTDATLYALYSNVSGTAALIGTYKVDNLDVSGFQYVGLLTKYTKTNASGKFQISDIQLNTTATDEVAALCPTEEIENLNNGGGGGGTPDPDEKVNGQTTVWQGMIDEYYFDTEGNIELNAKSDITQASIYMTQGASEGDASWQFRATTNLNTSSSNMMRIFLSAADEDLKNGINVALGDAADNIALALTKNGTNTKLATAADKVLEEPKSNYFVRVERYIIGDSALFAVYSDVSSEMRLELTARVETAKLPEDAYVGILTKFSSSNKSDKFKISNFETDAEASDAVKALQPTALIEAMREHASNPPTPGPGDKVNGQTTVWQGMTDDYYFDTEGNIELNSKSGTSPAIIYATAPRNEGNASWQFRATTGVNTSSSNMMRFFIAAEDTELKNGLNIAIGDNADNFALALTKNGTNTKLLATTDSVFKEPKTDVFVRLESYEIGDTILFALYSDASSELQLEATVPVAKSRLPQINFVGIQTKFSKTNASDVFKIKDFETDVAPTDAIKNIQPTELIAAMKARLTKPDDRINGQTTVWQGMTDDYFFDTEGNIELNSKSGTSPAIIYATAPRNEGNASWQFRATTNLNTSSSNMMRIFLAATDTTLQNGINVALGDNADNIALALTKNGTNSKLAASTDSVFKEPHADYFIRVERFIIGDSALFVVYSDVSSELQLELTATVPTAKLPNDAYAGIVTKFSKSNASDKFKISDFAFGKEPSEAILSLRPTELIDEMWERLEGSDNGQTEIWKGMIDDYYFDEDENATLNSISEESPALIYRPLPETADDMSWQFRATTNLNTSSSNMMRIFLAATDTTLQNGINVALGDNADNIALALTKNGTNSKLAASTDSVFKEPHADYFIRIERFIIGDSALFVVYSDVSSELQLELTATVPTAKLPDDAYTGIVTKFSKSNASDKFKISDFTFGKEPSEAILSLRPTELIDAMWARLEGSDNGQTEIWKGMIDDYYFDEDENATLNSMSEESPALIYRPLPETADDMSWQFRATTNLNTSSSNMMRIFLAATDTTLQNGINVALGDNADNIALALTKNGTNTKLAASTDSVFKEPHTDYFIRVERFIIGDSALFVVYSDVSSELQLKLTATVSTAKLPDDAYAGIVTKFSKSNASDKFKINDFAFDADPSEAILSLRPTELIDEMKARDAEVIRPGSFARGCIIINELMPAPSDALGLPNAEYVELYNASDTVINLKDWTINDKKISKYQLNAGEYVIVCAKSKKPDFAGFEKLTDVTSLSLANATGKVTLCEPFGDVIDYVEYSSLIYNSSYKDEGGWSMERIDVANRDAFLENWAQSVSPTGGTPGEPNSVKASNPDTNAPELVYANCSDDGRYISMVFTEAVDTKNFSGYINLSGIAISAAISDVNLASLAEIKLKLIEPLMPSRVYSVNEVPIADFAGNKAVAYGINVGILETADANDLIISEIMASAKPNTADFVEIFNRSGKNIDLSTVCFGIIKDDALSTCLQIAEYKRAIFPGEYVVLTADSLAHVNQFAPRYPANVVTVSGFKNLAEDGIIAVCRPNGDILNAVSYSKSMHSPLLPTTENVSLELIRTDLSSSDPNNWASASASSDFSTPTEQNSQFREPNDSQESGVSIENKVFTPDGDGIDDVLSISCNLGQGDWYATLKVYSSDGALVAVPYNNQHVPISAELQWNGMNQAGAYAAPGTYIVLLSLWQTEGETKQYKKTCIISTKHQ